MNETTKRIRIRVFGRVQGVFFRHSARREADRLGLTGFVRNEADGSLLIEREGRESLIQDFLQWTKRGPKFAKVEKVDAEDIPPVGDESGFSVEWK